MDLAKFNRPSLWYSLLWKDFQLIRSTLVAVTIGVFSVQLISLLIPYVTEGIDRQGTIASTSILASISPILFAVGCAGMLIGHERQTGTWAWSSSLPVSWRQALASKLVVTLCGAAVVGATLAIVPLTLLITGRLVVSSTSLVAVYVSGLTAIALLEVTVCFYVASLLIRDTLTALVVAGLALSLGQIMVALGVVVALRNAGFEETRVGAIFGWVSSVLIVLLGAIAMIATFRWRWGAGQLTEIATWPRTSAAIAPKAQPYRYTSGVAPSEWRMHLQHSFTNSRLMRLTIFLAVCLLASIGSVDPGFLLVVASLATGIYGLTAFEGDQTQQRFRFLADRGIAPWRLVASRLSVAAFWATLTICVVMALLQGRPRQPEPPEWLASCVLGVVAFLLSALASLCFRKVVIAATVAMVVSLVGLSISMATIEFMATHLRTFGVAELDFRDLSQRALRWTPLAMLVLLVATFRLARRWIIYQEPRLPLQFAGATSLAFFLPALLAMHSIFLLIPNVPWQGVPLAELRREPIFIPDLKSLEEPSWPPPIEKLNGEVKLLLQTARVDTQAIARFSPALEQTRAELLWDPERVEANVASPRNAAFIQRVESFVARVEQRLASSSTPFDVEQATLLVSNRICRTATLATIVASSGESDLALRLWRINRNLQELAMECDVLATSNARNFSMLMLQQQSDAEIRAMGGADVFHSLIPRPADERSAAIQESREWATFGREYLRGHLEPRGRFSDVEAPPSARILIRYYLPVRWFLERKLALDMQIASEFYATQRKDWQTGEARDALLQRIP